MTNKFTFEVSDATLARAIIDLIAGGVQEAPAAKKPAKRETAVEAAPAPVQEAAPAPVQEAAPAPVREVAPAPVQEVAPAPIQAPVLTAADPLNGAPVTADMLMGILTEFLNKEGAEPKDGVLAGDRAKAIFARHDAPASVKALVDADPEKAKAVYLDFLAQVQA